MVISHYEVCACLLPIVLFLLEVILLWKWECSFPNTAINCLFSWVFVRKKKQRMSAEMCRFRRSFVYLCMYACSLPKLCSQVFLLAVYSTAIEIQLLFCNWDLLLYSHFKPWICLNCQSSIVAYQVSARHFFIDRWVHVWILIFLICLIFFA